MALAFPIFLAQGGDWIELSLGVLLFGLIVLVPLALVGWAAYAILSAPARRQERARLFLHLVTTTLEQGRPLEPTLISIANCRDRSPGVPFHLFAAHLEEGARFAEAVRRTPGLVPAPVTAILACGERLGDLRAVLPACRYQLRDARSALVSAVNYFFVLAVLVAPLAILLLSWMLTFVMPKLREIFESMSEGVGPSWIRFADLSLRWGLFAEWVILLLFVAVVFLYVGGPWMAARLGRFLQLDALAWRVPWKRSRMKRDFAAMLAVLLDHRVPEPEAVRLAAECSANEVFRRRAARAQERLAAGERLPEAVAALDPAGELQWRFRNATHGQGGFLKALRGWLESLDARAFRQEQTASQLLSTALVVGNGLVVGMVCAGVFGMLANLIQQGVLW